ncbi:nucleoside-diphosphate sugar epimerase/dehydratase [Loktanella salsilacus]|uniref:polysaccharide biosynthesis protein n=1 Tax=Loktanella salsilacus TaxID=195913 RepID=UPI0030036225
MYYFVISLSRKAKQMILLAVDVCLVPVTLWLTFVLQANGAPIADMSLALLALPLLMMLAGLLSVVIGIHRIQLKAYESHAIALTGIYAVLLGLATAILDDLAGYGTPLATFINFMLVCFLISVAVRVVMLQVLLVVYRQGKPQSRILIYGAGQTGRQLAAALGRDENILPVAFIDDSVALQSTIVRGLSVYSPVAIETLIKSRGIDRMLLAMPSLSRPRLAQLSRRFEDMGLDVQTLPSFAQLTGQEALVDQLQPMKPGQFLGRAPLDAELPGVADIYQGRNILISGAGGSIGSELCRQVLGCAPARLVLVDISELALYTIDMELRALAHRMKVDIVPVLGSITDTGLMVRTMANHEVNVVLHAAAYKHVPLVERNAVVGMSNNVLGTQNIAQAALEAGVDRFILISSDKAVRPTNMMGASKRLAEIVVQDLASRVGRPGGGRTLFSMVRFGNVVGSSGSVIPLFQKQIEKGGPITLTHRDVTRFFMTIPEAARLVLVSGSFGRGGDVFVLDMGDPISIYDLARQMITASNYTVRDGTNPEGDIEIKITGLRPGEKIHEELLIGEGQITTLHPKILQAREGHLSQIEVAAALKALRAAIADADDPALRQIVARWVEGGAAVLKKVDQGT